MKRFVLLISLLCFVLSGTQAQRMYQKRGRGVVAVTRDGGTNVTVSWRKLTNDPDSCTYNLYRRTKGSTSYTKVNATPYSKTNVVLSGSVIPYDNELAVTTVSMAGVESEKSVPYLYKKQPWNNVFMYIEMDTTVLKPADYRIKYVWPADLNGDGELNQFIVDRLGGGNYDDEDDSTAVSTSATNHKIQAYDTDGTLLWTVALGPNVNICSGQNDMVTVCDIDCDGKAEVIIKSSDGTRFWDKENETWGKYPFGKNTGDVDGDGIIDYCASGVTRNPPFYISVIDGMTGAEKVSAELDYSQVSDGTDVYTRNNKQEYMSNKGYYQLGGHFAICYDGVHPFLAMKCLDRTAATQSHHDYVFAFGYDWVNGEPTNFHHFFTWSRNDKKPWPAEFHGNRVCDVDGDGIDEIIPGAFAVNPWKGMVSSAGIGHGDRFTVGDLDPTRPGLEHFAIQQSNLLGQVIYDAATGEHLKEWYLPSAYDVGAGQCMDVDSTNIGYECYSYVNSYIYDCKGKKTNITRPTPNEGVWWDGDLLREALASQGGSGYNTNMDIEKVPGTSRLIDFSREASWEVHGCTGRRPAFWGDITGDWREEVILMKARGDFSTGIVGYATDKASNYSITCLQEDGHYRGDCSTKGYYQSPATSFYLGHGMKLEPLFDCVETDLRWKGGSIEGGFVTYNQRQTAAYADGKSVIFDISGDNSAPISINNSLNPSTLFLVNPKGHDYIFNGNGTLSGETVVKKGMQGTATFNMDLRHTGKTVINEGTLCVNGTIYSSPIHLLSRGTLAGNVTINSPICFEGALAYDGCRLMPASISSKFGTITVNHSLVLPGNVYIETDIKAASDSIDRLVVNGDLTLEGINYFTVNFTTPTAGTYTLAECTGKLTATTENIGIRNLDGVPYRVQIAENKIQIVIDTQREATTDVTWTGSESSSWDYLAKNFAVNGTESYFVTGDKVVFDDTAAKTNITLDGKMVTGGIVFNNNEKAFSFTGDGGMSGTGDLIKNGKGEVKLILENSDYTGRTIINNGRLTVSMISDGGKTSSIGASGAEQGGLQINGGELCVDGDNVATDRIVTITDSATINVLNNGSSLSLKDQIKGRGVLVKTGAGQLNLNYNGTNDFDGLVIRGGTIAQGAWNGTFGRTDALITFEGGTLRQRSNTGMNSTPNLTNPMHITDGTENTIMGSYRANIRGKVTGGGQLTIQSGGIRNYIYSDFSEFTGTLVGAGAELLLQNSVTDLSKATLKPTGSISVSASELSIGQLVSDEKTPSVGGTTVNVGSLNTDFSYAGKLTGTTFNKVGTGTWELTGTSSTASITVKEGTLRIRNFSGATTSSSLTVMDGAKLTGRGTTQSILLRNRAVVQPGIDDNSINYLGTSGNFIGYGGATIVFKANQNDNDRLRIGGTLRLTGDTIRIKPIDGRTFMEGETIQIIEGSVNSSSKWVIDGGGYDWDDSYLKSNGTLVCQGKTTDIHHITEGEPDGTRYFDATGLEVTPAQMRRHGVYIERTVSKGQIKVLKIRR